MIETRKRSLIDKYGYVVPEHYGLVPWHGAVATFRPGEGPNGLDAIAVEEGTENLIFPNRRKFEGWQKFEGAEVVVTQGYEIPGITPNEATRIQTYGGTSTTGLKYLYSHSYDSSMTSVSLSLWIYNIGNTVIRLAGNSVGFQPNLILPGEIKYARASRSDTPHANPQIQFRAEPFDNDLDFIAFAPQIEMKPFATSFVDGVRGDGVLAYPQITSDKTTVPFTLSLSAKAHESGQILWLAGRSTGFWLNIGGSGRMALSYRTADNTTSNLSSVGLGDKDVWKRYTLVLGDDMCFRGYVNGDQVLETPPAIGWPTGVLGVGMRVGSSSSWLANGLLSDVLFLPYATTPAEVLSWGGPEKPLPIFEDATIQWGTGGERVARTESF